MTVTFLTLHTNIKPLRKASAFVSSPGLGPRAHFHKLTYCGFPSPQIPIQNSLIDAGCRITPKRWVEQ
jgi:hypothetical protein